MNKRSAEGLDKQEYTPYDEPPMKKAARAERKKLLEKKRRDDMNKGFDQLTALIMAIDPLTKAEANEPGRKDLFSNRTELVNRTVEVLSRIHRENEEKKTLLDKLSAPGIPTAPPAATKQLPDTIDIAHLRAKAELKKAALATQVRNVTNLSHDTDAHWYKQMTRYFLANGSNAADLSLRLAQSSAGLGLTAPASSLDSLLSSITSKQQQVNPSAVFLNARAKEEYSTILKAREALERERRQLNHLRHSLLRPL